MQRVVLLQSLSKQYLSAKHSFRRHKKAWSMAKLIFVSCICLGVFSLYAVNVSASSTKGWKLDKVQAELEDEEFLYSIAKLEILKLEGKLLKQVNEQSNFWYDNKSDRNFIEVITYDEEQLQ